MNDEKPSIFRRIVAWLLDSLLALAVVAVVIFFTWSPSQLASNPGISQFLETSPLLEDRGRDIKTSFETLKANLSPEEIKNLLEVFQETIITTGATFKDQDFWNPAFYGTFFSETFQIVAEKVKTSKIISNPLGAKAFKGLQIQLKDFLTKVKIWDLMVGLFPLVLSLLFLPILFYLAYFIPEIFMGASFGQWVLRIRAGNLNRDRTNFIQNLIRFACKHSGLILIASGLYWSIPLLSASGFGILLIMSLSVLTILGSHRQALYETLSGTALWKNSVLNPR